MEINDKFLNNGDAFPLLGKLISIVSAIPESTVACE
jgi:hypothetical protein